MSAVEEIEAAIWLLNDWREQAEGEVWTNGTFSVSAEDGTVIVDDTFPYNASLIVVLHRTIDAQLAILSAGLKSIEAWVDPDSEAGYESWDGEYPPNAPTTYLGLARAINGTTP